MSDQQQGMSDDEMMKVGIAGLITIMVLIAILARQEHRINAFIGAVTWLHIFPFATIARYVPVVMDIPVVGPWLFGGAAAAHDFLIEGGYAEMTKEARWSLLTVGGRAATVIYGFFLVWIAFRGQEFRVDRKYRSMHSLESMIWLQSDIWPTSRISRFVNPLNKKEIDSVRISKGVAERLDKREMEQGVLPRANVAIRPAGWNRSLRPEEWLLANGLSFDREKYDLILPVADTTDPREFEFRRKWEELSLETISEVLSEQLRSPWKGPMDLSPTLKSIYAVMALFHSYDIDGGNRLLFDLGVIAGALKGKPGMDKALQSEKGMMARIDKICSSKAGSDLAREAAHHAWVESAFPTLISAARLGRGVLPPAAFVWLKPEDRLMWYILDCAGNDAIMVEAAGAMAHNKAENQIGKPLRRPAVYQAARALLEDYLDMTDERIEIRHDKEVRTRSPGDQLDLIADSWHNDTGDNDGSSGSSGEESDFQKNSKADDS